MPVPSATQREPILIKWYAPRGVLFDADLNFRRYEELVDWAARDIDFVVVDMDTGEDITRILLAHWDEGHLVDPLARRVSRA